MRTLSADTEKIGLRELIKAVGEEPVTVLSKSVRQWYSLRRNSTGLRNMTGFAVKQRPGCAKQLRQSAEKRPSAA